MGYCQGDHTASHRRTDGAKRASTRERLFPLHHAVHYVELQDSYSVVPWAALVARIEVGVWPLNLPAAE